MRISNGLTAILGLTTIAIPSCYAADQSEKPMMKAVVIHTYGGLDALKLKLVQLLAKMHQGGVPIVAGTDGSGIEIVRELEIYHEAGLTNAEAAAATIAPARLVGQEKRTGSIKVGKAADLALVEGDPFARLSDLRQTRVVMMDGKLMDADALRTAAGFSGRPK